ncbi:MAG: hypothetical protein Q9212_001783 [Teloschistes hypoglaucus]
MDYHKRSKVCGVEGVLDWTGNIDVSRGGRHFCTVLLLLGGAMTRCIWQNSIPDEEEGASLVISKVDLMEDFYERMALPKRRLMHLAYPDNLIMGKDHPQRMGL